MDYLCQNQNETWGEAAPDDADSSDGWGVAEARNPWIRHWSNPVATTLSLVSEIIEDWAAQGPWLDSQRLIPALCWQLRPYTEHGLRMLARYEPEEFLLLFDNQTLRPVELTFAAEILGESCQNFQGQRIVERLTALLVHPSPLVREGAIYGLAYHLSDEVVVRLGTIAQEDPSPGVRAAAASVL